jgi:hypothetical protein
LFARFIAKEERMKCIFCKKERKEDEFSSEHVFPESIGGSLQINTVCRACNSILGSDVDSKLTDHFFVKLIRYELGLTGKKGRIPLPFKQGELVRGPGDSQGPIRAVFRHDGKDRDLRGRVLPKQFDPKITGRGMEQHKFVASPEDAHHLVAMVQSFLKKQGLTELSKDEILAQCKLVEADPNLVEADVEIDTLRYKRAVAKIAYELAYQWLGVDYVEDPVAEKLRRFVLENLPGTSEATIVNGRVGFRPVRNSHELLSCQPFTHIGRIKLSDGVLVCDISIFNLIRGSIIVSETPERYPEFASQGIEIEPATGSIREL